MKTFTLILLAAMPLFMSAQTKTFHDFTVKTIEGEEISLSKFKGKKILVVNTASKCGYTPQYASLERLYSTYKDQGLLVIGFPANNFMKQEPGTNEEIAQFCSKNYGVSFPMMEKISVKGKDMHPLYHWLTEAKQNGKEDAEVDWNFQKFMIDEDGKWIGVVGPGESPECDKIINWIKGK